MQRFIRIALVVFIFISVGISQDTDKVLLSKASADFYEAEIAYRNATFIGSSAGYDEKKEEQLNRKALVGYRLVESIVSGSYLKPDSLVFFPAFRTGELEHYFGNQAAALAAYTRAIAVHKKTRLPDSLLFRPLLYAGIIYYNSSQFDSAASCFTSAENIQLRYQQTLSENERLYNLIGVLNYEKGDYLQAKNYFLKAIEVLPVAQLYYKDLYVNYNINLAQMYLRLEDYATAKALYEKLLPYKSNLNEIYHNLGSVSLALGKPSEAIRNFRKVNYNSNKLIRLQTNMGSAFAALGQIDSAIVHFKAAMAENLRFGMNADRVGNGLNLVALGDLESRMGNPGPAVRYYQQAIHEFYPAFSDSSIEVNPSSYSGVFSYINLFNVLMAKGNACEMLYRRSGDTSMAITSLDTYRAAFDLTGYVERTYNSDEARLFLEKTKYEVHSKPIDIAFELYRRTRNVEYLHELYFIDQQNKASVLSMNKSNMGIPVFGNDSLVTRANKVRTDLARVSLHALQSSDSSVIAGSRKQVIDLELELGRIRDQITSKQGVPVEQIPAVETIQATIIGKATKLISFHLGDSSLTTLVISNDSFNCFQKKLPGNFHKLVNTVIQASREPDGLGVDNKQAGLTLYHLLFDSIPLSGTRRLVLIPDDELNYLSFESLQDDQGRYLVEKTSVQYQYSTALLKKEKISFSEHKTLAFAPFAHSSFKDSTLAFVPLPGSVAEVAKTATVSYVDEAATKSRFLEQASKYGVLHLATHAMVNNQEKSLSYVAFNPAGKENRDDYLLYEQEIYNLPLKNNRLIILSACETGSGDLVKGEGVMSLSRAFSYAGCSNILTTLWKADDNSTAYITTRVHKYLEQDLTIDKALQQAKLDYLADRTINPRLKNPYFWSHLIFVGNYGEIEQAGPGWLIAGAILITLAGIIVWLLYQKRKGSTRA